HLVVVEVALLHTSFLEGQLAVQGCPEPERDAALDLGLDAQRIDRLAAVDRAHHPMDADAALGIDRNLRHLRDDAPERLVERQAPRPPGSTLPAPAGLLRGGLEHLRLPG